MTRALSGRENFLISSCRTRVFLHSVTMRGKWANRSENRNIQSYSFFLMLSCNTLSLACFIFTAVNILLFLQNNPSLTASWLLKWWPVHQFWVTTKCLHLRWELRHITVISEDLSINKELLGSLKELPAVICIRNRFGKVLMQFVT